MGRTGISYCVPRKPLLCEGRTQGGEGPAQETDSDARCNCTAGRNVVWAAAGITHDQQQLPEAHDVPNASFPKGELPCSLGHGAEHGQGQKPQQSPARGAATVTVLAKHNMLHPGVPRRHGKAVSLEAHENLPGSAQKSNSQNTDQSRYHLGA